MFRKVLLGMFWISLSTPQDLIYRDENYTSINWCLDQITDLHFNFQKIVVLFDKTDKIRLENKPIVLQHQENSIHFTYRKATSYIINLEEPDDLQEALRIITEQPSFNPRAKMIILTSLVTKETFEILGQQFIYNVILVKRNWKTQKIYTYYPFSLENAKNPQLDYLEISQCLHNGTLTNPQLFPNKIPKTWRNTTIDIGYVLAPPFVISINNNSCNGMEMDLLEAIQTVLQFNITYHEFLNAGRKINESYSDTLKALQDKEINLAIGEFRGKSQETQDFDMTNVVSEDYTSWVVHKAQRLEHWKRLAHTFTLSTWLCCFLALLIVSLVFLWMSTKTSQKIFDSFDKSFVAAFQMILGSPLKTLPRTPHLRVVFWCWSLFFSVFSTLFLSRLIQVLTENIYQHQVNTEQDIMDAGYKICASEDIIQLYKEHNDPMDKYVRNNYEIGTRVQCMNRTNYSRNFATPRGKWTTDYYMHKYIHHSGRPNLHICTEKLVYMFWINWYFQKGFPLYEQVDSLVIAMRSKGLVYRSNAKYEHYLNLQKFSLVRVRSRIHLKKLKVKNLQGPFVLLIFGYCVSLIVFIVENVYYRNFKIHYQQFLR